MSEFVSLKKINKLLPKDVERLNYLMLVGMRTGGKSFLFKQLLVEDFIKNAKKGVLIRRREEDFKKGKAKNYWRDVNDEGWIKKWTKGAFTHVTGYGSGIFLGNLNEKGNVTRDIQIGDYYALSTYLSAKSVAFPKDYNKAGYEEFISDSGYLDDEPREFLHMLSTISRGRDDFTTYMIGNSIDTDCIYFADYGLPNVIDQKEGTLNVVRHNEITKSGEPYTVYIGCYRTIEGVEDKSMFGAAGKQVGGAWESKSYTHPGKTEQYRVLYRLEIVWKSMSFIVELIKDKKTKGLGARVSRKKPGSTMIIKRVIYAVDIPIIDTNRFHTSGWLDIPPEIMLKSLLKDSTKVGYSTNLVATAFKNMLKSSKLLGWM